jgi:hypothetical protein
LSWRDNPLRPGLAVLPGPVVHEAVENRFARPDLTPTAEL